MLKRMSRLFDGTPDGMTRRHFMNHMASAAAFGATAFAFGNSVSQAAETLRRNHKSAILLWMGGGPPTIDIWDLKPGMATGGPSQAISTTGSMQISSLLPENCQANETPFGDSLDEHP